MFPFAHLGITFGVTLVLDKAAGLTVRRRSRERFGVEGSGSAPALDVRRSQVSSLTGRIDYRLILLGSMLPDIIDKPLGVWFHVSGRSIAHTLIFAMILLAAGFTLYVWRRGMGLLCLAFASAIHLVLDQMWLTPNTLFWPAYGWSFERGDAGEWWGRWLNSLLADPDAYMPEIIGILVLGGLFCYLLIRRGTLYNFVRTGAIG